MSIKFFIDKERHVLIERFEGNVTMAVIQTSFKYLWEHPDYDPYYNAIIDFRGAIMKISHADLKLLVDQLAQSAKSLKGKVSMLVSEPLAAALATLYQDSMTGFHESTISCSLSDTLNYIDTDKGIFDKLEGLAAETIDVTSLSS